nr:peptidoglycan-associated lipoprotein Pal [Algiphilus aromaticivorans]
MAQKKAELERENTVYFEFDSSDLSREGRSTVEKHADFLTRNPDVRVRLEGHTDERGTREYNIGLGERRAQAVARVLTARGVSSDQFSVVSYGEERPAVSGSNEEAWAKNRRVEIVYR